jgi:hypothetical protein
VCSCPDLLLKHAISSCTVICCPQLRREGGYALRELSTSQLTVLGGPELPADAKITVFAMRPESVRHPTDKVWHAA